MRYFTFQWHITEKCDQRCKHCYIHSNLNTAIRSDMCFDDMRRFIRESIRFCEVINRTPYFVITGGDPILHEDFWRLLELLKKKGIPFSILGNPFHLNGTVCKMIRDLGCRKYQMSLDGLEKTHDSIRAQGSFQLTLDRVKTINDSGIQSVIMTTVMKTNIMEIPDLVDVIVENNVGIYAFARYCPPTEESITNMVTQNEYRQLLSLCWEKFEKHKLTGTKFNLKDHLWTLFLYENGLFKIDKCLDNRIIYDGCNCAINHLTVLSDGAVYACRRMDSKVGNIFENSLLDIYYGKLMDDYRRFEEFEKCASCELLRFCRGCPAVAKCSTGNYYSPDPQCWK